MSDKGKIYLVLVILGVTTSLYLITASSQGLFPFSKEIIASPTPTLTAIPIQDETIGWKTYRDEELGFELKYPELISAQSKGFNLYLTHAIGYQHADPCDMKGDAPDFNKVIDFNVNYEILKTNLKGAVESQYPYFPEDVLDGDKIRSELAYAVGNFKGYKHEIGAEGCGLQTYYFPLTENSTLIIERRFSPERTPLIINYQEYLALPGIITVEKELEIFDQVLSTFIYKPAGQFCIQIITRARNPLTGEEKDFPTPCDVPLSWEKI